MLNVSQSMPEQERDLDPDPGDEFSNEALPKQFVEDVSPWESECGNA
jgi:hypothetical protein